MGDALGLKMTLQLHKLMCKHGVEPDWAAAILIPLSPPTDHPQVISGYASTGDLDQQRCRFRPFAFELLPKRKVPLLLKHDPKVVVGQIDEWAYDDFGSLMVRCTVHHEQARRMNAFSVSAAIRSYELRAVDDRDNFHALITSAELTEISLTPVPANPNALVMDRNRASPAVAFYDLLGEKVKRLSALAEIMRQPQGAAP